MENAELAPQNAIERKTQDVSHDISQEVGQGAIQAKASTAGPLSGISTKVANPAEAYTGSSKSKKEKAASKQESSNSRHAAVTPIFVSASIKTAVAHDSLALTGAIAAVPEVGGPCYLKDIADKDLPSNDLSNKYLSGTPTEHPHLTSSTTGADVAKAATPTAAETALAVPILSSDVNSVSIEPKASGGIPGLADKTSYTELSNDPSPSISAALAPAASMDHVGSRELHTSARLHDSSDELMASTISTNEPETIAAGPISRAALSPSVSAAGNSAAPAKAKSKSHPVIYSPRTSDATEPASASSHNVTSLFKAGQQFSGRPSSEIREQAAVRDSSTIHSASESSGRQPSHSSHAQTQSAASRDSSSDLTGSSVAPIAPDISSHASITATIPRVQSAPTIAQPSATPVPTTPPTDSPLAQSAAVAQPSQSVSPTAANPQPHFQANPIADPPRMVDSGQLRVAPNTSELKISVQLPDLGKVEVRAVTTHELTTAHLTTSNHDALQVLAAGRTGLEQALKARDVVLGSMDSHAQEQSAGQQRQQGSHSPAQFSGSASTIAGTATNPAIAEAAPQGFLPDYSSISVRA